MYWYESLYTAGAIFEQSNNSALANSFFRFFLEIQGVPEGRIRNRDPLTLTAASLLSGFPAGAEQNFVDYVSNENEIIPLFNRGLNGIFWTGDEIEVARLVPDESGRAVVLTLTPVPEPSTVISSVLGGLIMIFGFKIKKTR